MARRSFTRRRLGVGGSAAPPLQRFNALTLPWPPKVAAATEGGNFLTWRSNFPRYIPPDFLQYTCDSKK